MTDHDPIATAWSIHSALADWTGKVDSKASFALTLESAVLAGVITLSSGRHQLDGLHGFWLVGLYWTGIVSLVLGIGFAAQVVKPKLRRRHAMAESGENFIYFGHLRNWDPEDLEQALLHRSVLPVLSRQLVSMSQIAWRKHLEVQLSMLAAGIGTLLVVLAAVTK